MSIKRKAFVLISTFIVGIYIIGTVLIMSAGIEKNVGKADIALVLGNKVNLDGTPELRLLARLDKAVELYSDGYFPRILVSGAIGKEGFDEAEVMRNYLVAKGIPDEAIIVDSKGYDTYESAKNTLNILTKQQLSSVFVVTQYFHIPRTRLALKRLGIRAIYHASADIIEIRDLYSLGREILAYVYYYFRSYNKD